MTGIMYSLVSLDAATHILYPPQLLGCLATHLVHCIVCGKLILGPTIHTLKRQLRQVTNCGERKVHGCVL